MAIRYGRLPQLGEKSHGVASIPVPCAGLIDVASRPSLEAVAHEYNSYLKLGARSVKFKVGHLPLISDIEGLLALRDRGGARFRLDAGRKLSAQAFRELRAGLRGLDIEFFEEPLGDFALSETEAVRDPYPLALDEWFWDRDIDHDTTASFYVLKPSRLGGISRTVRWIHRAQQKGAQIILSSCYDTGLAMMTYAYLCEYFHLGSHDMGLGTYPMLAQDVLEHRLCLAPGMNFIPVPDEDLILNKRVLGSEF
jgi:O-succinylbenzoate synthase